MARARLAWTEEGSWGVDWYGWEESCLRIALALFIQWVYLALYSLSQRMK